MKDKTILFVDDSGFDRGLLVAALSRKGTFRTLEAESGEKCLEILTQEKVDLVLMDIMMPGSLGTQVLEKIREKFNAISLPIIMVTSKGDSSDIVGCLQQGANDYITKPVNFEVAVSRISTHLQLAELSREMSRLKELAALDAMISTYNHEINNPLAIAIGCLDRTSANESENKEMLKNALWRIADITKKIRAVSDKKEIEYQDYVGISKTVKFR